MRQVSVTFPHLRLASPGNVMALRQLPSQNLPTRAFRRRPQPARVAFETPGPACRVGYAASGGACSAISASTSSAYLPTNAGPTPEISISSGRPLGRRAAIEARVLLLATV